MTIHSKVQKDLFRFLVKMCVYVCVYAVRAQKALCREHFSVLNALLKCDNKHLLTSQAKCALLLILALPNSLLVMLSSRPARSTHAKTGSKRSPSRYPACIRSPASQLSDSEIQGPILGCWFSDVPKCSCAITSFSAVSSLRCEVCDQLGIRVLCVTRSALGQAG